jgi:hypothetical protein
MAQAKAHRVLTQRGVIEATRPLGFDKSSPPACNSRADFTPFLEREVSVPAPPPAPIIEPTAVTSSPAPTSTQQFTKLSPATDIDGEDVADTEYETVTPVFNPVFNVKTLVDDAALTPAQYSHPPASLSPTHIPPAPPLSFERSNKGQHPERYGRYRLRYVLDFPGKKAAQADAFLL